MWGIFAIVAFAIALILHLLKVDKYVLDFELLGFILLTVHVVVGNVGPWFRRPPA
jgi:hypothetical protein